MNLESAKISVVNVGAVVVASFALYFFIAGLVAEAVQEAKIYAITLDIERDQDVIDMYIVRS